MTKTDWKFFAVFMLGNVGGQFIGTDYWLLGLLPATICAFITLSVKK